MKKKRRKNPKGRMPPALARYWRQRRRKSNPRKRRRNPVHLQHVLYAQRSGGPELKYLGGIKFSTQGTALRFASKQAALTVARSLRRQFKVLRPYRMWAT